LFCFPHAGGQALTYRPWQSQLPNFVEVCPVELPGHGTRRRDSPLSSLSEIVDATGEGITSALDLPCAFFGHSMGAVIAFELARRLEDTRKAKLLGMFASGREAPHLLVREPLIYDLPDPEFLAEVSALNGIPDEILRNHELMELLMPTLRADFTAIETYRYRASSSLLTCPITVLGGLADSVTREELEGWQAHTDRKVSVRMFRGDHFFLYGSAQSQVVEVLARELLDWTRG